jgi:outer membrane protein assembly factor BamB
MATMVAPATAGSAVGPWPQFGGAPDHRFNNVKETTIDASNVASLVLKWEASFGDGSGIAPTTAVTAAAGLLFVASADDRLHALDPATGTEVWYAPITGIVDSTPAVAGNLVIVGTLNGPIQAFPVDCVSPCPPAWSTEMGGTNSPPVVVGSRVYIGGYDGGLHVFDARTGAALWEAPVNRFDPLNFAPTVSGGHVYVAGDLGVSSFPVDCATPCSREWLAPTPFAVFASVSVSGGLVDAVDYQGHLAAIDALTGAVAWVGHVRPTPTGTAVAGGRVYVGTSWSTISGFAQAGCQAEVCAPAWHATIPGPARGLFQPSVANGVLYIGSIDGLWTEGSVFAFASCTGACTPVWSAQTDGAVEASPVVADGRLYVTTLTGNVEAFGLPTG